MVKGTESSEGHIVLSTCIYRNQSSPVAAGLGEWNTGHLSESGCPTTIPRSLKANISAIFLPLLGGSRISVLFGVKLFLVLSCLSHSFLLSIFVSTVQFILVVILMTNYQDILLS